MINYNLFLPFFNHFQSFLIIIISGDYNFISKNDFINDFYGTWPACFSLYCKVWPLKTVSVRTPKRARLAIFCVYTVGAIHTIPYYFSSNVNSSGLCSGIYGKTILHKVYLNQYKVFLYM